MPTTEVPIGSTDSASLTVQESDLASSITFKPSSPNAQADAFTPVFATVRMIALMEVAASRVLAPYLKADELSVGVIVNVKHSAATPVGATVRASAKLSRREGNLYVFEVVAKDEGGEIGKGEHKRAIITAERLSAGAKNRSSASRKASL